MSEDLKIHHFVRGLRPAIRAKMMGFEPQTVTEAADIAQRIERSMTEMKEDFEQSSGAGGSIRSCDKRSRRFNPMAARTASMAQLTSTESVQHSSASATGRGRGGHGQRGRGGSQQRGQAGRGSRALLCYRCGQMSKKKKSKKIDPFYKYRFLMIKQGAYISTSDPWRPSDFQTAIKKQLDEVNYYAKLYH